MISELDRLVIQLAVDGHGSHYLIVPGLGMVNFVHKTMEVPMPRYRSPLRTPDRDRDIILDIFRMEDEE